MKVGFIDYFLDEWHANNYPEWIKDKSNGRYEVAYAWAKIDNPNGITNKEWAEKFGVELLPSIQEVVDKSDVLIVLSPDNPEMHEELCEIPLSSGKHVYVDKTFALTKESAEKIFAVADAHGTKCYSCSALRFASELSAVDKSKITKIYSEGPGKFEEYAIHQIEPIVYLMNSRAKRVMFLGDKEHPSMIIEFADGRTAQMYQCGWIDFKIKTVDMANDVSEYVIKSDYFGAFIENMIQFFDTGEVLVKHENTIDVIAIIEAGIKASKTPYTWVNI